MDKMGKSSGFTAAYKLKSGSALQKKDARLRRRSVEWKTLRGEEVDKRRNIKNLSPLQEAKENRSHRSMHKDKSPTKDRTGEKTNDMREKLMRWREEKALKKKLEAQEKAMRKPFIIKHVVHSDTLQTSKGKKGGTDSIKDKQDTKPLQPKSLNKGTMDNISINVQKKHGSVKLQKQDIVRLSKPATERTTRSTNQRTAKTLQSVQDVDRKLKNKTTCKKSASKSVDLKKVSTTRGMSFAPEEFTFTAPNNLASFVFKPLSPTSSENFLSSNNPDESAAFLATDLGRCSTPKRERAASVVIATDEQETENFKENRNGRVGKHQQGMNDDYLAETSTELLETRRQTRSLTKYITQKSESLSFAKNSSAKETESKAMNSSHGGKETYCSSRKSTGRTPSRSRKSINNASVASTKSRTRSSSRELPSRSRSRKRSHSQEEGSTTKRRKSRRSVNMNPSGGVQVDVMTSPEQQEKPTDDETDQIVDSWDKEEKNEKFTESTETSENQVMDEVASKRTVTLSEHSLTVEVTEDTNQVSHQPKPSPLPNRRSRRSTPSKGKLAEDVPSTNIEEEISAKASGILLKPEPDTSDDTEALLAEKEETNEVFSEGNSSPAPRRKSRRSIRMRPDFVVMQEDFTAGDKENSKPKKITRRSLAVVDGFKLPSESMSTKRTKPKQRRHTLHVAKSPEEWVEILKSSPMVEMSRRTPKQKSPVSRMPVLNLELDLDDLNLPPKEEVQNDLDISKVILANLNSSLSADEYDAEPTAVQTSVEQMEVAASDSPKAQQDSDTASISTERRSEPEHDVNYFRNLVSSETTRYNVVCEKWEAINTPDLSEEVQGQIRSVIGQAKLLIAQRFKQFIGLVDNCEFKLGEKETTFTDLQGFWDMIYFQVEDVDKKFEDLQQQKEAGWVKKSPDLVKKVVKKKFINKPVIKKPVKSKFAAFKASMKSSAPAQTIEHDWGLFKVTSPIRKPTYHCEGGSPKSQTDTRKSPMPLQPRPDLSQPVEESTSQSTVPVIQHKAIILTVEDVPIVRTPKRQSYLPAVPSPLLQDSTPQPRFTRSLLKTTPSLKQTQDITTEKDTPRHRRQSLRRSINLKRRSVSFVEEPVKPESPANESFSKYLQPSQSIPEETSSPVSVMDSYLCQKTPDASLLSSGGKAVKSTLKQTRRRSARRSVSFCSPLQEKDKSCLRYPPTPHSLQVNDQESDSGIPSDTESKFADLNVALTPVTRSSRSRPSLLFTPPNLSETPPVRSPADVAVGTLISFSP